MGMGRVFSISTKFCWPNCCTARPRPAEAAPERAEAGAQGAQPGSQLTRREAERLLDALRAREPNLPPATAQPRGAGRRDALRDW